MSVHVTDTTNADGTWTIAGDECGHTSQADPSTLNYGQNMDGSPNKELIVIPCPECGVTSFWPRETLSQDIQERLPA